MAEPIVQSSAGFTARRSMVQYLERELEVELEAAEQGLPLRETHPPPILGAFVLTVALALIAWMRRWRSKSRRRHTAIPRAFYGEHP